MFAAASQCYDPNLAGLIIAGGYVFRCLLLEDRLVHWPVAHSYIDIFAYYNSLPEYSAGTLFVTFYNADAGWTYPQKPMPQGCSVARLF